MWEPAGVNSERDDEECDATDDDSSTAADKIITLLLFLHLPFLQMLR